MIKAVVQLKLVWMFSGYSHKRSDEFIKESNNDVEGQKGVIMVWYTSKIIDE